MRAKAAVPSGAKPSLGAGPTAAVPADNWVVRGLRFFDRHNGAFNAMAALAVALFTWRLWLLNGRELKALGQQSKDVERSIAESARAASAMEVVAKHMGTSAQAAAESVATLRERTAKQMRAYLTVQIGSATFQDRGKNLRFDGRPLMLNTGMTPARHVKFRIAAEILPCPLPDDFLFPLDEIKLGGATLNAQQNFSFGAVVEEYVPDEEVDDIKTNVGKALYVWGIITYDDVFDEAHRTEFGLRYQWLNDGTIYGRWVDKHNECD